MASAPLDSEDFMYEVNLNMLLFHFLSTTPNMDFLSGNLMGMFVFSLHYCAMPIIKNSFRLIRQTLGASTITRLLEMADTLPWAAFALAATHLLSL